MGKSKNLLKVDFGFVFLIFLAILLALNLIQPEPVLSQNEITPAQTFD